MIKKKMTNIKLYGSVVEEMSGVSKKNNKPYHFLTILCDFGLMEVGVVDGVEPFGVNPSKKMEFVCSLGVFMKKPDIKIISATSVLK